MQGSGLGIEVDQMEVCRKNHAHTQSFALCYSTQEGYMENMENLIFSLIVFCSRIKGYDIRFAYLKRFERMTSIWLAGFCNTV